MMTPPDLDATSRQALLRSLGALSMFLKLVMAMSSVLGSVPDWIWKPLAKLFPKIGALEDGLFNLDLDADTRAALTKQRADWEALMRERSGAQDAPPQNDRRLQLIGATLPEFLQNHAVDFSIVETDPRHDTPPPLSNAPESNFRPDHSGDPGLDPGRTADSTHSTDAGDSENPSIRASASCGHGSRHAPGCTENEALFNHAHASTGALQPAKSSSRPTRKPMPRARPPPSRPKSKSPPLQHRLERPQVLSQRGAGFALGASGAP